MPNDKTDGPAAEPPSEPPSGAGRAGNGRSTDAEDAVRDAGIDSLAFFYADAAGALAQLQGHAVRVGRYLRVDGLSVARPYRIEFLKARRLTMRLLDILDEDLRDVAGLSR